MTARSLGQIAASIAKQKPVARDAAHHDKYRGKKPRVVRKGGNGVPVRRNSYYEGQIENRIWRPFAGGHTRRAKRTIGALLKAARMHERQTRLARQRIDSGSRNGALGQIGIAVLDVLGNHFLDYRTGRLDPSVEEISRAVGHSYNAVHNALKRLRDAGYLQWMRRSRKKENAEAWGPQVEQISNAYAILIPKTIKDMIDWIMGRSPKPDDDSYRREQQCNEWEEMLASLTSPEYLKATWLGDSLLGESLKNIALLVEERESSRRAETRVI